MLTNALQRRTTPEFDANATPRCGVLLSIEGHPAFVARGKNKPSLPSPASPIETRPETARHVLEISPASHAKRRVTSWNGMTAEIVQATSGARTAYRYRGSMHLLVLFEQATRREAPPLWLAQSRQPRAAKARRRSESCTPRCET